MKKYFTKAIWLVAALLAGATAQAQSVKITQGSVPISSYCLNVDNIQNTKFGVVGDNLIDNTLDGTIVQTTWTVLGGIDSITSIPAPNSTITIRSKADTTASQGYSMYAKGRLSVKCKVAYTHTYIHQTPVFDYEKCVVSHYVPDTSTYTYHKDYSASIEIHKQFASLDGNEIVGPECVVAGTKVTYSVAPWVSLYQQDKVGFDEYHWSIPPGASSGTLYRSADKSSVTFTAGSNLVGNSIEVKLGSCDLANQTPAIRSLAEAPEKPMLSDADGAVSFDEEYCLPLAGNGTSQEIVIANYNPRLKYEWAVDGWGNNFDTLTHTLSYTPWGNEKDLRLTVRGTCGVDNSYTLKVKRSLTSTSKIKTVQNLPCLIQETAVRFTVEGISEGATMSWEVEGDGWSIKDGEEHTYNPTVTVGSGAGKLTAKLSCGDAIDSTFQVTPLQPMVEPDLTCLPDTQNIMKFNVTNPETNAIEYRWVLSNGWTIVGDATGDTIRARRGTIATTAIVQAIGYNNCPSAVSAPVTVDLAAAAPAQINVSQSCLNFGTTDTVTLSVEQKPGETYVWDVSAFGDSLGLVTVSNTTGIKVVTDGVAEPKTATVHVAAKGTCPESNETAETMDITDPGYRIEPFMYSIPGYGTFPIPKQYQFGTAGTIISCNTCTYKWWLVYQGGAPDPVKNADNSSVALNEDIEVGTDYLLIGDIIYSNGCRVRDTYGPGIPPTNQDHTISLRNLTPSSTKVKKEAALKISPNPAQNVIRVTLNDNGNNNLQIRLVTVSGTVVHTQTTNERTFNINVSAQPSGMYVLVVASKGKTYQELVLINR